MRLFAYLFAWLFALLILNSAHARTAKTNPDISVNGLFTYRTGDQPVAHCTETKGAAVSFGGGAGGAPVEWRWNGKGWARRIRVDDHDCDVGDGDAARRVG